MSAGDATGLLLDARDLVGGYGAMDILKGVSLRVETGRISVIAGPNGAGKSTALKAIFGLVNLRGGQVTYKGADITGVRPDRLVAKGLAMVPQLRNVFPNLTVLENLQMGACQRRDDLSADLARIFEIFPPLAERRGEMAGLMSGGQRQMVAIGRALMSNPTLLLLDEPTAGLSPAFVERIFERILAIRDLGMGILMVEQNARQALMICDHGYVLASGENRHEGSGQTLLDDPEVARSFLGG